MRVLAVACLMSLSLLVYADSTRSVDHMATVEFMEKLAEAKGGYLVNPRNMITRLVPQASLRATSGMVRAIPKFGGELTHAQQDADFVDRCFDAKTGGFAEHAGGNADVFHTAVGLLAAVELKMPLEKYREPALKFLDEHTTSEEDIRITAAALEALGAKSSKAEDWIEQISAKYRADGPAGEGADVPVRTANMAMTVLRLGGALPNRDAILALLRDGQNKDGGFGNTKGGNSDLESCYRVVRTLNMLKAKPRDVDALKQFVFGCRNADGGYGLLKGSSSSASGCYYAGFVLDWLKQ